MNRLTELKKRFDEILNSQNFNESELDYQIADRHLELIKQFDSINTGALSVFDLNKKEHIYFSPKFSTIFGWDMARLAKEGVEYSDSLIHPEDLLFLMEAGCYFASIGFSISTERRANIKMYVDYRMKIRNDEYFRVVEQHSILESDKNGNVWLSLSTLDLSPYNDIDTPLTSRMIDVNTGQLYEFPTQDLGKKNILTMREKEILELISKGLISKQIADKLYISVNTVNTHRQRIIEKLDVSNTFEAVRFAGDLGILPGASSK